MAFDNPRAVSQALWEWLAKLHTLTAGTSSAEEAEARIDLVAGMIARRFPDALFTDASLEHVAGKCRFWPAYGEIVAALADYRETYVHQPRLALPAPVSEGRAPPKAAELQHVRGAIEGLMQELAAARVERQDLDAGPKLRPLADVTAKGEALARIRAAGRKVLA